MDIQKWLNDQNIEAVQDRRDGKDYWMYDNLYTEIDLIELLEAFSLHVVIVSFEEGYKKGWQEATKEACQEIKNNYRPNER